MQIRSFAGLTFLPPSRPVAPRDCAPTREPLESTPLPPGLGLKEVDKAQGSLAYAGPPALRNRLEVAAVKLIGLRHGQSESNAEGQTGPPIVSGQSESPLTAKGREQAAQAAQQLYQQLGGDPWLQQAAQDPSKLPVVYSSTLSRASDTAQALVDLVDQRSQELGTPVHLPVWPERRLLEMHFGRYEQKPVSQFVKEHPVMAANWDSRRGKGVDFQHRFPEGESRLDVMIRVASLLDEVAEKHKGRTVLLVCHQETLVGVRTALGLSRQRDGRIRSDSQEIQNAVPINLVGA